MTREQFSRYAATVDNWFEPATLDRLNSLAFERLADVDVDDRNIEQLVKSAFDYANNVL